METAVATWETTLHHEEATEALVDDTLIHFDTLLEHSYCCTGCGDPYLTPFYVERDKGQTKQDGKEGS